MKLDKKTLCLRLEQGIPYALAQVVPDEMEITVVKPILDAGSPLYRISEVHVYGTAEDIVDYMIVNELFPYLCCEYDIDFVITKVGRTKRRWS